MTLPVERACLIVLDGWGLAAPGPGNAVSLAATPTFDDLWERYPHTQLDATGRAVGLPEGQMGNSEVGHLNLGAGAVVVQDLTRIDDAVATGELARNEVLRDLFGSAERVHLIGLVSDGGVHSGWRQRERCRLHQLEQHRHDDGVLQRSHALLPEGRRVHRTTGGAARRA